MAISVIRRLSFQLLRLSTLNGRCFSSNPNRNHTDGNANVKVNDESLNYGGDGKDELQIQYLENERKGIVVFSMQRFRYKNAMGHNLMKLFNDAMKTIKVDTSLRTLIVRSEVAGVFCAGADLRERAQMTNGEVSAFTNMLRSTMMELDNLPMPTIAAVDGAALGGGLEMALACDMRIAASNARMGLIETSRALIPGAGGTQRLPRVVGRAKAKELILTSRIMDGWECEKNGVVNHCVEQNKNGDAAFQRALLLADEMADRGPIALRMAKAAVNRGIEVEIDAGMKFEEAYYAQVIPTKDRQEGMKAFLEKRPPKYEGH